MKIRKSAPELQDQDRQWSRHAAKYDELFLDAFHPGVESPLMTALAAVPEPAGKTIIDLGCGTGPLLPHLIARFGRVLALDFAPAMITRAKTRLGRDARSVTFLTRPMDEIDDLAGTVDVAVAVNSVVMPDVRLIDRTLRAIRAALRPDGVFLGVVPSMDAIHYHTMLLMDQALDKGARPKKPSARRPSTPSTSFTNSPSGGSSSRGWRKSSGNRSRFATGSRRPASARSSSNSYSIPGTTASPAAPTSPTTPGAGTGRSEPVPDRDSFFLLFHHEGGAPMSSDNAQAKNEGLEHQDVSIKARKVELFEEPKVEEDLGARRPFAYFVRATPAAPLSPLVKAALWATGVLVVLLLLGAFILGGPKKIKKPQAASFPTRPAVVVSLANTVQACNVGWVATQPTSTG